LPIAAVVASCTNTEDIDLDKDVSLDVQIAPDGLSVPLGDLAPIYLDSILDINDDPDAVLCKLEGGVFGLKVSGNANDVNLQLDDISLSVADPAMDPIKVDFGIPSATPDATPVPQKTLNSPVSFNTEISIDEIVDDALLMVAEVDLKTPSPLSVKFDFSGVPDCVNSIYMSLFKISFPDFLQLTYSGSDTRVKLEDNSLVIDGPLDASEFMDGCMNIEGLSINGLSFDDPLRTVSENDGRHFRLNSETVGYNGVLVVKTDATTAGEIKDKIINVDPSLSFSSLDLGIFIGKIFPEIDSIEKSFEMTLDDDASDFLRGEGSSLELSDLQLALNLTTNFSIPVLADLTVSSFDKSGNPICNGLTPDDGSFIIPAAPRGEDKTFTLLFYKQERPLPVTSDTVFVRISNLSDLMTTIPDRIDFRLDAKTDTSMTDVDRMHYADLTSDLKIDADYKLLVPFVFDDLHVKYSTDMDGLSGSFEDISEYTIDIAFALKANVENTIPMNITLTGVPYDKNGNEIKGITISSCNVPAGSLQTPATGAIELTIDASDGILEELDRIELNMLFDKDMGQDNVTLKSSEYLQLKNAAFYLPDGISMNFDE